MVLFAGLEIAFNVSMMLGPVLAGGVTAGLQATKGIDDACSQLTTAQNQYSSTKSKWRKVLQKYQNLENNQKDYATQLNRDFNEYKEQMILAINSFKKKQFMLDVFFAIFIFCLLMILLFKYFKIFENIKKLILN
jgi:hypothetical protein